MHPVIQERGVSRETESGEGEREGEEAEGEGGGEREKLISLLVLLSTWKYRD